MRVVCHSTKGTAIPLEERYLNEIDATDYFPIRIGDEYLVYGLLVVRGRVDVLVCPKEHSPLWVPTYLFNVIDRQIQANWRICLTLENSAYRTLYETFGISCVIGYPELVTDFSHYCGILERNATDMVAFFKERESAEAAANSAHL